MECGFATHGCLLLINPAEQPMHDALQEAADYKSTLHSDNYTRSSLSG